MASSRWTSLSPSSSSPSSSSSSGEQILLRAAVSVIAGLALTVLSAIAMRFLVLDPAFEKLGLAPQPGDGGDLAPSPTAAAAASAPAQRLAGLRLTQHERALLPDLVWPEDMDAGVDDVGGLDAQLAELREQVLYPLTHPHLFAHSAVAQRPTGMLLYGPPGTGKTLLAKAVAKSTAAAFLNVNVAALQSKWFGETPKLVAALFSLARKLSPCVIFVDEVDGFLGRHRDDGGGGGGAHGLETTAITTFLQCWEGLRSSPGTGGEAAASWVLVICATNRPEALDAAVLRRMPRRIRVGMPDARARADILRVLVRRERAVPLGAGAGAGGAPRLDLALVASRAVGFSGSDLREVVREAAMGPIRDLIRRAEHEEAAGAVAGAGAGAGAGGVAEAEAAPRLMTTADLLQALARVPPSGVTAVARSSSGEAAVAGLGRDAEGDGEEGAGEEEEVEGGDGQEEGQENEEAVPVDARLVARLRREAGGCEECARSLAHLGTHLAQGLGGGGRGRDLAALMQGFFGRGGR